MQLVETAPASKSPFSLDSPTLAKEIKIYMDRHEATVGELISYGDHRAGAEASRKWACVFDGLLCAMFGALRGSVKDEKLFSSLSLAAVGSYGRGNFSFRSDLDVRILCSKPKQATALAEALLYPLWDAGLQIGHQVVTVQETLALAKKDLPTATTLLDWRHLAGDPLQTKVLREKAFGSIFSGANVQKFLSEMHEQAESRAGRFGDSVYLLEPDVKNGQGGIRDLDIVNWTALSRWRASHLKDLVQAEVLAPAELSRLEDAAAFLARVRNILHYWSPRRTERLSFEGQELVAEKMGYGRGGPGCEEMMSEYYKHARVVSNARESLLMRAEPPARSFRRKKDLGGGLCQQGTAISVSEPYRISQEPVLALRAYWAAVHADTVVDRVTREAIARAMTDEDVCARLRGSEEANRLFRRLVRLPRRVAFKRNSTLSEFHDVGILLAMIPEFRPLVGRVHHDIYHVYTVDVHSIAAVDRLRKFCRGEMSEAHPIAGRLAGDIARPQVLFMAALLHDIGKDEGGRSHSDRGAEISRPILERLGVQEHDIIEIQHLIVKHLRMYHVASRRDIDDPATIDMFRSEVHGPEGLKELYLLTLCDVSTTSPTALTTWKARMMEELFLRTRRAFEGLPQHTEERAKKLREATMALCPDGGESEFLKHFLDSVPDRYLYANEPEQIVGHSRLARLSEQKRTLVDVMGVREPYVELGVVVDDKPGALADITASFNANRISVIGAQLYAWKDRLGRKRVLDIFWVSGGRDANAVKRLLPKVREDLEKLVSGQAQGDELIESRRSSRLVERPAPDVSPTVSFDNRSSSVYTIIEVTAEDVTGLLYRLSTCLKDSGLEVSIAKINTEGNRVVDVFYVADRDGNKLTDEERVDEVSQNLLASLPEPR